MKDYSMKLILILLIALVPLSAEIEKEEEISSKPMIDLIERIIETPPRMIEIMINDEAIDCTNLVNQFKNEEWRLIAFTTAITYINCKNYLYDTFEVKKMTGSYESVFYLHYIYKKGEAEQDVYSFKFYTKENKIIFGGIVSPLG
ncbi:MAG: hypothetical protein WC121_11200 [Candidatus Kapaibacterium sp.]